MKMSLSGKFKFQFPFHFNARTISASKSGTKEEPLVGATPDPPLDIPVPIEEYVDYSSSSSTERSNQNPAKEILHEKIPDHDSTDTEQPAVEEAIQFTVAGQAEMGLTSTTRMKGKSSASQKTVKRAEGISIASDMKSGGGSKAGGARAKISKLGLDELQDLIVEDFTDEVNRLGVSARSAGSMGASQSDTARSHPGSGANPSDVQQLKRTVRRLTSELSRLLTAPRGDGKAVEETEGKRLLPGKGPLPPWLCDPRVFAPLMAAYEDRLTSAGKAGADDSDIEARLLDMEARILDIVRENDRLRLKLRETTVTDEPASQTEWDAFTEQARLVLEENQLLIRQLSAQQAKAKLAQRGYLEDAAKLKCRIEELEAENSQVRAQFDGLHDKLQEVKKKYQAAALERETGEMKTVDSMRSLSKELFDTRDEFVRANEEILRQLQKSEREKVKLTKALSDAVTERDGLRLEVSELKTTMQLNHKEMVQLHKSSKKRDTLQEYLESVVGAASDLQQELDTSKGKFDEQNAELSGLVSYLVNELKFQEKKLNGEAFDEESLDKMTKLTSKFEFLIQRFAALLKVNEDKREQLESQVSYLQSLIRHKSQELQILIAEHRNVQEGLETVWNAAVS